MRAVGWEIVDPLHFERHGYPHAAWDWLRRHEPVARFEPPGMLPFWAITKYADLETIARDRDRFRIAPRMAVFPEEQYQTDAFPYRHLLNMDPPEHVRYRRLTSQHFTPKALEPKRAAIGAIVDDALASLETGGEVDFVAAVSKVVPLAVIAEMLGIPRADWDLMFDLSNLLVGADDPELHADESTREASARGVEEMFGYFRDLSARRRREPADDFVTLLATATIDGRPLGDLELLSYYALLVVAGNETTRNATSGGLLAMLHHPGELERLRRDPALLEGAVEEIVRWTSPVVQFCRTAVVDVEIRGVTIPQGEAACLFYPSANRDEEVFPDAYEFRIDREPNEHYGFGIGIHHCLGANLARIQLQEIFRRLATRYEAFELAGPVERLRSSFVGGIKRMPIRCRRRERRAA